MNRTEVIQSVMDKKNARTYLEIGVEAGINFFLLKAKRKIAVDPNFLFSQKHRIKRTIQNPYNFFARFHQKTSDDYFADVKNKDQPDVVFIDGLHSYQQSLKDVNNALAIMNEEGVIIMHDCSPPHEAAAQPANSWNHAASMNLPGWTNEWCGDVWKTICNLRSNRKDLRVFVLDCDYGLGIITRGKADDNLELSEQEIEKMTFDKLSENRQYLLNLKDVSFFPEFLKSI